VARFARNGIFLSYVSRHSSHGHWAESTGASTRGCMRPPIVFCFFGFYRQNRHENSERKITNKNRLFLFSATITITFMNTNSATAFRTSPFLFFSSKKCSNSKLFNIFKILDHAHFVFGSISFIQMFQIIARKLLTFKTIFCLVCLEKYAIFDCAFNTSNRFIEVSSSATRAFIFNPQICHADTTVHPAWSNE